MKSKLALIFLLTLSSCICRKALTENNLQLKGTALHYSSAMGSGKGVIFRFTAENQSDSLWLDSVYVLGKKVKSTQNAVWPFEAEANYFVPAPMPGEDHAKSPQVDSVLEGNYSRAYLYVHNRNQQLTLQVNQINRIQNNE